MLLKARTSSIDVRSSDRAWSKINGAGTRPPFCGWSQALFLADPNKLVLNYKVQS